MTIGPFTNRKAIESIGAFPVSVADFKAFHEIDFDDHDVFIGKLLQAAVGRVEIYTGLSLIGYEVQMRFDSIDDEPIEFRYGPVVADSATAQTLTGEAIPNDAFIVGMGDFPVLLMARTSPVVINYTTGYETLPEGLRLAVLWQAWEQFNAKNGVKSSKWQQYAEPFRRPWKYL